LSAIKQVAAIVLSGATMAAAAAGGSAAALPLVLVTGASGLLGRAVLAAFRGAGDFAAAGTAFSRAEAQGLLACDLRDAAAARALVLAQRPALVVHSAAERRPDACEKDEAGSALRINVDAVFALARAAADAGAGFVYVSTDYLFAGDAAPYDERAEPAPLNAYGRLKLRGEHAALAGHPAPVLLRVPVLFGPTADLGESAVTTFAVAVRDAARRQKIDDWQIRVPTFTPDVGATIVNIARALERARAGAAAGAGAAGRAGAPAGIYHYSSQARFTRFSLVAHFARQLGLDASHIEKLEGAPPGAPRPFDCALNQAKLEALGLAAPHTPFEQASREVLVAAGLSVVA
jgi:dTDP-4-dehydrorhamnose reductase